MKFLGNVAACACGISLYDFGKAAWLGDATEARVSLAVVVVCALLAFALFWFAPDEKSQR